MKYIKTNFPNELPTWIAIFLVYFFWWIILSNFYIIPFAHLFLVIILTFHGSVQHEILHGHPTGHQGFNDLLAYPSIALWSPYFIYKSSHLKHHEDINLTIPNIDPESYFISKDDWHSLSSYRQKFAAFNMTLLGRLTLGPLWYFFALKKEFLMSFKKPFSINFLVYFSHEVFVVIILYCIWYFFNIHFFTYIVCAYLAHSLTMLRSFYEHRSNSNPNHRSVIMQTVYPLRILFLNNNYHFVHHKNPDMSWHQIPREYNSNSDKYNQSNGFFLEKGYSKWFKKYLVKPVSEPKHPAF
ncbi:MAG: hypothetical protein HN449_01220 [Thiotrichales bacterium]|jgi:fatty acid desaturase|nr:hypothetical protein [Thiotrichales bacterium]MBT4653789.1 hypothetical protein [Thiotrichales bacterium]MBT7439322.1 hypothetical protein [Thiotrichales bacterium]